MSEPITVFIVLPDGTRNRFDSMATSEIQLLDEILAMYGTQQRQVEISPEVAKQLSPAVPPVEYIAAPPPPQVVAPEVVVADNVIPLVKALKKVKSSE